MEPRRLERQLHRVIRGELRSADIQRLAEREGFRSFSELCESSLPETLREIRLDEETVLQRLRAFLAGELELFELWFWADELYHISYNHEVSYAPRTEDLITSALSAIGIVANDRIFMRADKIETYLAYVAACLERGRRIRVPDLFATIFDGLPLVHLAHKKEPTDDPDDEPRRWADVVILDRQFSDELDLYLDYNWLVAFSVRAGDPEPFSESAFEVEELPELPELGTLPSSLGELPPWLDLDAGLDLGDLDVGDLDVDRAPARGPFPAGGASSAQAPTRRRPRRRRRPDEIPFADRTDGDDLIQRCRDAAPNFDLERYRPRYRLDDDGLGEITLATEAIGPAELVYATKLFCLANRVRVCWLDGRRVKTIAVDDPPD